MSEIYNEIKDKFLEHGYHYSIGAYNQFISAYKWIDDFSKSSIQYRKNLLKLERKNLRSMKTTYYTEIHINNDFTLKKEILSFIEASDIEDCKELFM